MRQYVLKSLAVVLVAASCSSGAGPTHTKTVDPLRYTVTPAASAVGYDTSVVSWSVGPRPAKGQVTCPGMDPVGSGALAPTHSVVLRGLSLGTGYSCRVSSWEDGSSPIETSVSFQTRVEPCADTAPSMASLEMVYTFPTEVAPNHSYFTIAGYACERSTSWGSGWLGEPNHAATSAPGGTARGAWSVIVNQPFGSKDHVICAVRGDGHILQGSEFVLRVAGGSGGEVHLTRTTRRKPFDRLPEMDCWLFRLDRDRVYP